MLHWVQSLLRPNLCYGRITYDYPGSISHWLDGLRAVSPPPPASCGRTTSTASSNWRGNFRALPRCAADEEDVALSAFDSFCRGAEQGRFPRLARPRRPLASAARADPAQGHRPHPDEGREQARMAQGQPGRGRLPDADFAGREPDPAFAAQVAEECQRLLGHASGRRPPHASPSARWKATPTTRSPALLGCSLATVERRLRLIRKEWEARPTAYP